MTKSWRRWLEDIWYKDTLLRVLLLPLACLFWIIVRLRKYCYQQGWLNSTRLPVPVIVVGNITVGGTGKTPLVIWLAQVLQNAGFKPGVISRGYGGNADRWPQIVTMATDVKAVGDEPYLIARQTQLPVVVGPLRAAAGKKLLSRFDCNVVISDDGLQHYRLQRDIEIVVIDGDRRFGNGYLLPAGPLRESVSRLQSVDFIVVNGNKLADNEFSFNLKDENAVNLNTGEIRPLAEFKQMACHAVAGIGNPERFFSSLARFGINCEMHNFSDHYDYGEADFSFGDDKPVLMTEKDAVKCFGFAQEHHWYVPVKVIPEAGLAEHIIEKLTHCYDR
jgi:tetraacyldisaccharide 4'-kinase